MSAADRPSWPRCLLPTKVSAFPKSQTPFLHNLPPTWENNLSVLWTLEELHSHVGTPRARYPEKRLFQSIPVALVKPC